MTKTVTPFRYPGGKAKLAPVVEEILKANNLEGCAFYEAFAGGAGLGLELLKKGKINWLILNDMDDAICSFWSAALNLPWRMIEKIMTTPIDIAEWERQSDIYEGKFIPKGSLEDRVLAKGFSALFLNRVNFSGIIQGGVIGGKEQTGTYKMDCRFNRKELATRILDIFEMRERIFIIKTDVLNGFFKVCEAKVGNFYVNNLRIVDPYYLGDIEKSLALSESPESSLDRAFFYFDPPYYEKGKTLYRHFFTPEQHEKFAELLKSSQIPYWALSYDNCEEVQRLWGEYTSIPVKLNHSVKNKGKQEELMFFSKNLKLM